MSSTTRGTYCTLWGATLIVGGRQGCGFFFRRYFLLSGGRRVGRGIMVVSSTRPPKKVVKEAFRSKRVERSAAAKPLWSVTSLVARSVSSLFRVHVPLAPGTSTALAGSILQ